ncbi:RNA polymerase sigma factor RpoE [Gammaproteobacteria bacterium LSUCC0057]|jgi:RNA polymerase sigma-70 factor (ECF subfamily)|uniref:RNA polymerase sigma factor RpoE n=1 Tax=Gammaproteobacteria bacterium LSUCC0057 TaxID=2559237 RepID=A0A4Y8UL65_9GAMM|nr:RNA polymerase sigma factor RpoE [Gammaproteobacteria bacterium LSUCC0057]
MVDNSKGASHSGDSDALLVERVQHGDKRAFDLLVLKYQGRVQAIVGRFVRDRDEIADVSQEAFIKAYRALPKFRGDSQFYTWLYRIAVNCAKNYLLSRSRRPPGSDIDMDDSEQFSGDLRLAELENPENALARDQLAAALEAVIEGLPQELRSAVTLREYDGLSYEEIAEVMSCPVGTVRSRIFRAREAIEAEIARVRSDVE